jgi:AraC family transcriptional regulator, L-rhamnose operon transcriptional activator RhaR
VKEYKSFDHIDPHEKIFVRLVPQSVICNCDSHLHEFIEIVYIISGFGIHHVDNTRYHVNKGGLLFINAGHTHAHYTETGNCYCQCFIDLEFFNNEIINKDNALDLLAITHLKEFHDMVANMPPHVAFDKKQQMEIESIFSALVDELTSKSPGYRGVIKGYINILFAKIFRAARQTDRLLFEVFSKIAPEVLEYIKDHYNKKITLDEVAKKSYYNPSYFSKIFKECYGKPFVKYLSELRVNEAIRLLQETDCSVKEICFSVGYQSKNQFFRVFKSHTGMTPGQYRRQASIRTANRL